MMFTTGTSDQRRARPRLVSSLVFAVLGSAAVYEVLYITNNRLPYLLILAISAGLLLLRWALGLIAELVHVRVGDLVRPPRIGRRHEPGQWYEGGDGVVEAVRRWDRRLGWGEADADRFAHTVGRTLGELVDERLRLRFGITRATDPQRARALVGERVWAVLGPVRRPPSSKQVHAALDDLERISDDPAAERKDKQ